MNSKINEIKNSLRNMFKRGKDRTGNPFPPPHEFYEERRPVYEARKGK